MDYTGFYERSADIVNDMLKYNKVLFCHGYACIENKVDDGMIVLLYFKEEPFVRLRYSRLEEPYFSYDIELNEETEVFKRVKDELYDRIPDKDGETNPVTALESMEGMGKPYPKEYVDTILVKFYEQLSKGVIQENVSRFDLDDPPCYYNILSKALNTEELGEFLSGIWDNSVINLSFGNHVYRFVYDKVNNQYWSFSMREYATLN